MSLIHPARYSIFSINFQIWKDRFIPCRSVIRSVYSCNTYQLTRPLSGVGRRRVWSRWARMCLGKTILKISRVLDKRLIRRGGVPSGAAALIASGGMGAYPPSSDLPKFDALCPAH